MSTLAHLSLYRVTGHRRVPSPASNERRVQELRAHLPVQFANTTLAERIRGAEYQRAAIADAAPSTETYTKDEP